MESLTREQRAALEGLRIRREAVELDRVWAELAAVEAWQGIWGQTPQARTTHRVPSRLLSVLRGLLRFQQKRTTCQGQDTN